MKRKSLLIILLLALMVPLAALAQVERTVTVNNGTDKYHRVPAYGGREISQWYRNEFVIDKAYLQEMAGKQIIKMELYVAQPVPSSYMGTSGSYAVRIREKDWATSGSYSGDSPAFLINPLTTLEDQQRNGSFDFDGKGNIVVRFSSSFLYSGENNLVVQFESEKHNWLVSPFGIDNLPLYYGVNHTGYALEYCNTEQENTLLNGGVVFAKNQVRNFAPKVTFTYLDEATWANTNKPQNPVATALSSSSIRLDWEAGDYTGSNYQVLCVERGTTPSWSNAVTVNNTYYTFENLASNTTYDLYVRARTTVIVTYNSKAASATATTQHGGNLDEGPIAFDFGEGTHPNGLTVTGNDTHLVTYGGCLSYSGENTVTVTLPRLHFTNATNGLMLEFNMYQPQGSQNPVLVELVDEYQNETLFSQNLTCNSYQSFSFRLKDGLAVSSVMLHNCYKIRFTATGPFSLYNINVRKLANVIPASDLAATEITTTSAQINWTDDNTNSHTLQLYYRTKGYYNGEQGHWQGYVPVTGTSHILTGLTPYTEYEVMVKTIYGSDFENSATLTFGTLCPEQQVPYGQDFTGLDALPQYWRIEGETSSTTYHYYVDDDGITFTSSISGNWVSERNAYIILPYFGNLASLQFSFENRGGGGYVTVGVMTDPFDVSSFRSREYVGNSIGTHNINFGDNWASDIQYGHIALQVNKGYYDGYVQVDSFVVTRLAAPTGLTVSNVTNTTATLGWNADAATQWEVRYGTDANNYGTPVAVTEPTYTITGLTASTDYVAQVRAKYGDGLYSDWVTVSFKTLMQEAVVMDASHSNYSQNFNFINIGHGWMFLNVPRVNSDDYGWYWGNIGTTYSSRYCIYISDDGGTSNNYYVGNSYEIGGTHGYLTFNETTVYAAKTFNLAPGQYTFNYDYRVKGVVGQDYARVALVPADVALEGIYAGRPDGLTSTTLPEGWIALDDETALPQYGTTATWSTKTVTHSVFAPGVYMMVFIWHQDAGSRLHSAVQMPIAIDNVSVTWSPIITPPDMSTLVAAPTDTQATLTWVVPTCMLTPTSYEVEYATDASFADALTATTNTNSVTLTGLTANTNYYVRIRSAHTANGTTIYSDWSDARVFSTNYPTPTNLAVVRQTTSMAQVMWTPVELTLSEGQAVNYSWQLTTDVNDWGEANEGLASNGWERNLAPDTYHLRVRTAIYDNSIPGFAGFSDWSEPIQFTIAPWTDPVTLFPLTYGFETPTYFDDGLTLGGALERLMIYNYSNAQDQLPAHAGGESQRLLGFASGHNDEAYLVLPPLRPSTMDALVSFWWYHDNTADNTNEGVIIEQSNNGTSWTPWGSLIPRYAEETGWVKYQQVVPAGSTDPIYIRLHFVGADLTQWWKRCYLDDLTVNAFKSEQPYISYVGCDAYTATITLYDYAYQNGWPSSAFEVQYREWRDPSETQNEWVDYPIFENEAPYAFERTLTLNGLQPATCYEFRARARVSYNGYNFPWSNYCEAYRMWTDCGTYTITSSYSYTEDFEELFNGTDCWTIEGNWTMQQSGGHDGDYCAYCPGRVNLQDNAFLTSPAISFSGCNNAILRFWSKGKGIVRVYYGEGFANYGDIFTLSATEDWEKIELSLSYFMNKGPIKVCFYRKYNNTSAWYVDDVSIIANVYEKIFDCKWNEVGLLTSAGNWYPNGIPSASDEVVIMRGSQVYYSNSPFSCGTINFGTSGSVWVRNNCLLTVSTFNASRRLTVDGTANITTLNIEGKGSVVVNNGGTLYASTITGTSDEVDNTVVIEDGGQLKLDNPAYVTVKKTIGSYTEIETENNVTNGGYYLLSSPLATNYFNPAMAGACTQVTEGGQVVWTYDLYKLDYEQELEWRNYKDVNFLMKNGYGYLYANRDGVELSFAGPVAANNTQMHVNTNYGEGSLYPLNGWTLVGNPFTCNAYISGSASDMAFFRMNPAGNGFIPVTGPVAPMEGVFVYTQTAGQAVTFSREESTSNGPNLMPDPNIMALPIHALAENQDALLLVAQTIAMVSGWNWWTPMVQITAAQLNSMLNGCLTQIMAKDEENVNGELNPGQMYKLYSTAVVNGVAVTGVPVSSSITIGTGSNWIGYTGETTTDIAAALTTLLGTSFTSNEGDKIISQDGGFAIYNGTTWEGTLTQLTQGQGYVYVRY